MLHLGGSQASFDEELGEAFLWYSHWYWKGDNDPEGDPEVELSFFSWMNVSSSGAVMVKDGSSDKFLTLCASSPPS